jgi:hypothetical protein
MTDPKDASARLDRFLQSAKDQIGDPYRFGAETDLNDPNPTAFDSSELVEWAAHQAGVKDMPDGSWNQYRHLHDAGATVSLDEALQTKGALVFGFSSDPLASPDRPARAYVGISLGNGQVLDVSERTGEVRVMSPDGFYNYGATIPGLHTGVDPQTILVPGLGPSQPPADPNAGRNTSDGTEDPGVSYGPHGRVLQENFPDDEPNVCYPDDPPPEEPPASGPVCEPDDDADTPNVSYPDPADATSALPEPVVSSDDDYASVSASRAPALDEGFDDTAYDSAV